MRPLIVLESDARSSFATVVDDLRRQGWTVLDEWEVPGGIAPDARIVCAGTVASATDAERALLTAVWGAGVIIDVAAHRDVADQLCDDLRRLGPLDHRIAIDASPRLDDEQRALIRLLGDGLTLGDAAKRLNVSRRTADRRLASVRETLGVSTTAEALVAARRLGLD